MKEAQERGRGEFVAPATIGSEVGLGCGPAAALRVPAQLPTAPLCNCLACPATTQFLGRLLQPPPATLRTPCRPAHLLQLLPQRFHINRLLLRATVQLGASLQEDKTGQVTTVQRTAQRTQDCAAHSAPTKKRRAKVDGRRQAAQGKAAGASRLACVGPLGASGSRAASRRRTGPSGPSSTLPSGVKTLTSSAAPKGPAGRGRLKGTSRARGGEGPGK